MAEPDGRILKPTHTLGLLNGSVKAKTHSSSSNLTYQAADVLGGLILRDTGSTDKTDTLPTAAQLIRAAKDIGSLTTILVTNIVIVMIHNIGTEGSLSIIAGSGITLTTFSIAAGKFSFLVLYFDSETTIRAAATSDVGAVTALILTGLTASQAVVTDASKELASLEYTASATAGTLMSRNALGDTAIGTLTATSVATDTITEKTAATGVTIDGTLIKDGVAKLQATSNQLVTGTGSNLTTTTWPASSGAVSVTMPNINSTVVGNTGHTRFALANTSVTLPTNYRAEGKSLTPITSSTTLSGAQLLSGSIFVNNSGGNVALTLPTASSLISGLSFSANDAFPFTIHTFGHATNTSTVVQGGATLLTDQTAADWDGKPRASRPYWVIVTNVGVGTEAYNLV